MERETSKLFQVLYADGGGEQCVGESAEAVQEMRREFWGDREIVSVTEVSPKPN